jgi:hypothetical protein
MGRRTWGGGATPGPMCVGDVKYASSVGVGTIGVDAVAAAD